LQGPRKAQSELHKERSEEEYPRDARLGSPDVIPANFYSSDIGNPVNRSSLASISTDRSISPSLHPSSPTLPPPRISPSDPRCYLPSGLTVATFACARSLVCLSYYKSAIPIHFCDTCSKFPAPFPGRVFLLGGTGLHIGALIMVRTPQASPEVFLNLGGS